MLPVELRTDEYNGIQSSALELSAGNFIWIIFIC